MREKYFEMHNKVMSVISTVFALYCNLSIKNTGRISFHLGALQSEDIFFNLTKQWANKHASYKRIFCPEVTS